MKNSGRRYERIPLVRIVGINFDDYQRNYPTEDISLAGMFITGQINQHVGTKCTISLTERWADEQFSMNLTGIIARNELNGIAIQFAEMSQETSDLLQTVLLYSCNDPMSLCEEFAKGCPFAISEYGSEAVN